MDLADLTADTRMVKSSDPIDLVRNAREYSLAETMRTTKNVKIHPMAT